VFIRHEGSYHGLLSAVAFCLRRQIEPLGLVTPDDPPPLLPVYDVATERGIAGLFRRHFIARMGDQAAEAVLDTAYRAFLSEATGIAESIFRYLRQAHQTRQDPSGRLQDRSIAEVVAAARRVGAQAHLYLGLLRFRSVSGLYVADFAPDYHVLLLNWPHFADRLADQSFAICDRRRQIAVWHRAGGRCTWHILGHEAPAGPAGSDEPAALPEPAGTAPATDPADQPDFEQLWRRYLQHLTIPERRNLALQQHNMPRKYWSYLTEQPGSRTGDR
jgi:probable DNA metabolism protein